MPSVMNVRSKNAIGILVLAACLAGVHGGDVGGELGLLEGPFQHVRVGNGDFSPGLHEASALIGPKRVRLLSVLATLTAAADSMPLQLVIISL